jgi:hypothetical protein
VQPTNVLSEPRSFLGTAVVFASITALPFGLLGGVVFSLATDAPLSRVLPSWLFSGLAFGVLFGSMMAARFRGETAVVCANAGARLLPRLDVATAELGYFPASRSDGYYTYRPSFQAGLLAGRISVCMGEKEATIVGPRVYVRRLLKRL